MDSAAENESLTYLVKFDRSGENITTQWSNEDERNIRNGFSKPDESGLSFTGSKSFTAGIVPLSWTSTKSDISKDIYNEYSFLIKNKCHPKVAGVIAVMKLLQKTGAEVNGKQLQALITQYNPTFPAKNASLFHAIGQVGLLKNENGIVTLNTIGCKPILYANLKLEDEARFNVSGFDNMDLSVNMIEGFRKAVKEVSLTLNSLLIDSSSGNLVLDYDHDHTLKTVSLEIIFPK